MLQHAVGDVVKVEVFVHEAWRDDELLFVVDGLKKVWQDGN